MGWFDGGFTELFTEFSAAAARVTLLVPKVITRHLRDVEDVDWPRADLFT